MGSVRFAGWHKAMRFGAAVTVAALVSATLAGSGQAVAAAHRGAGPGQAG
jgi:hypothetical protein